MRAGGKAVIGGAGSSVARRQANGGRRQGADDAGARVPGVALTAVGADLGRREASAGGVADKHLAQAAVAAVHVQRGAATRSRDLEDIVVGGLALLVAVQEVRAVRREADFRAGRRSLVDDVVVAAGRTQDELRVGDQPQVTGPAGVCQARTLDGHGSPVAGTGADGDAQVLGGGRDVAGEVGGIFDVVVGDVALDVRAVRGERDALREPQSQHRVHGTLGGVTTFGHRSRAVRRGGRDGALGRGGRGGAATEESCFGLQRLEQVAGRILALPSVVAEGVELGRAVVHGGHVVPGSGHADAAAESTGDGIHRLARGDGFAAGRGGVGRADGGGRGGRRSRGYPGGTVTGVQTDGGGFGLQRLEQVAGRVGGLPTGSAIDVELSGAVEVRRDVVPRATDVHRTVESAGDGLDGLAAADGFAAGRGGFGRTGRRGRGGGSRRDGGAAHGGGFGLQRLEQVAGRVGALPDVVTERVELGRAVVQGGHVVPGAGHADAAAEAAGDGIHRLARGDGFAAGRGGVGRANGGRGSSRGSGGAGAAVDGGLAQRSDARLQSQVGGAVRGREIHPNPASAFQFLHDGIPRRRNLQIVVLAEDDAGAAGVFAAEFNVAPRTADLVAALRLKVAHQALGFQLGSLLRVPHVGTDRLEIVRNMDFVGTGAGVGTSRRHGMCVFVWERKERDR